jgi:hypothetical protein
MTDLMTFLEDLDLPDDGPVSPAQRRRVARFLAEARAFPQGYWHPEDAEALAEVAQGCLDDLDVGGDLITEEDAEELVDRFADLEDEDEARRHQIGALTAHINRALVKQGADQLLHPFAEDLPGWEAEEPVWLLLTTDERETLMTLGVLKTPDGIEADYAPV